MRHCMDYRADDCALREASVRRGASYVPRCSFKFFYSDHGGVVTSARVRNHRRRGLVCGLRRSNASAIVALYGDTLYTCVFAEDFSE
jgi:hypothetical protein